MPQLSQHHKIARLRGLSGYPPRQWCSVCGITAVKVNTYVTCVEDNCTNVCHIRCLDDKENFHCEETYLLRSQADIDAQVEYITSNDESNVRAQQDQHTEAEEEDNTDWTIKSKEEIIEEVKQLRHRLRNLEPSQNHLHLIVQQATRRREEVLSVLCWIDQLTAAANTVIQANVADTSTQTCTSELLGGGQDNNNERPTSESNTPTNNPELESTTTGISINFTDHTSATNISSQQTSNTGATTNKSGKTESFEKGKYTNMKKSAKKQSTHQTGGSPGSSQTVISPAKAPARSQKRSQLTGQKATTSNTCNWCHKRGHTEDNCRASLWC